MVFGALRRHGSTLLLALVVTLGFALPCGGLAPNIAAAADWGEEQEWERHDEETREWEEQTEPALEYTLLNTVISGAGTVQSNTTTYCQNDNPLYEDCESRVAVGTALSLSATPSPGWTFLGWEGACSGTGACELTMNTEQHIRAKFDDGIPPTPPTIVTPAKGEVVQQGESSGVLVTFNNSGDSTIESYLCRLDTSDYRLCFPPWTTRHLKPGPHTVRIKTRDSVHNTSTPVTRRFTVAG
ncbi:MAG TPA: hypothetical protein VN179_07945 [Solirubrobacterales bacterium]|nr:hypothetical protein [Solirubrobacterales bacterium]